MLSMVVAMSELRVLMSLSNILGSFMLEGGDRTTHRRAAWMHRAKGTATIRASRQPGGAAASAAACLHRIEVQDVAVGILQPDPLRAAGDRSEEHTSELQSLMRSSYAVFCLKKKKNKN